MILAYNEEDEDYEVIEDEDECDYSNESWGTSVVGTWRDLE